MNLNNSLKNIAGSNYEALILEMRKKVARNNFYEYCRLINPYFYREERKYLKELCDKMQDFVENSEKQFLIINLPPRHGKSYTATNFTAWLLGRDNSTKIMTASYNETLSTEFAKQVRDTIATKKVGKKLVYNDIFPRTKIKKGDASASLWALQGSTEKNYLATSPNGTCIGIGARYLIVDDMLKNSMEAYNERNLESQWDWFSKTLIQRKEGEHWKVIIIMTRWVNGDLSGRLMSSGTPYEHIMFKALQDDGSMLCRQILNRKDYDLTADLMNDDIFQALYQQEPMDIAGRLYEEFIEYDELPAGKHKVYNQTDTADTGEDYLCSINYIVHNGDVYVLDVIYTQEPMEITENKVAEMLEKDKVNESIIESNNGGRGFARNVKRLMDNNRTVIRPVAQTKNKVSRILTASGWVAKHVFMPHNWKNKYKEFAKELLTYQRKGKNIHDDACDTISSIYEKVTGKLQPKILSKKQLGVF